jgi:hypothetical protein
MAPSFAPQLPHFERLQFLPRQAGRHADAARDEVAEDHYGSILVDSREMAGL